MEDGYRSNHAVDRLTRMMARHFHQSESEEDVGSSFPKGGSGEHPQRKFLCDFDDWRTSSRSTIASSSVNSSGTPRQSFDISCSPASSRSVSHVSWDSNRFSCDDKAGSEAPSSPVSASSVSRRGSWGTPGEEPMSGRRTSSTLQRGGRFVAGRRSVTMEADQPNYLKPIKCPRRRSTGDIQPMSPTSPMSPSSPLSDRYVANSEAKWTDVKSSHSKACSEYLSFPPPVCFDVDVENEEALKDIALSHYGIQERRILTRLEDIRERANVERHRIDEEMQSRCRKSERLNRIDLASALLESINAK